MPVFDFFIYFFTDKHYTESMNIQDYFNMVDAAYDSGSLENIENGIKKAVDESGIEYGTESAVYASMLSELGGFYRGQTRYDEACSCFGKAIDILGKVCGTDSPDYATGVNNLAGTYRLMKEYDKAEELFRKCLEIYRNSVGENHILYSAGLNNLGLVCLDRHDTEGAAKLFEQCSAILKKLPEARDEYATSLTNTASLFYQLGRYDEAEKNLLEAVRMYEEELGTWSPHYHSSMNTLGLVYAAKGNKKFAAEWFEKSAAAAKTLYGEEHKEYKTAISNLESVKE